MSYEVWGEPDDMPECVHCAENIAEMDKLRSAIATAYGYLWHVNNEPGTPRQYPPERAAYEARKLLRDFMTKEQRGEAINRVRELMLRSADGASQRRGPKCTCGSTNTVPTGFGGYQAPDASRGDPGAEGDEYGCDDCGRCFIS